MFKSSSILFENIKLLTTPFWQCAICISTMCTYTFSYNGSNFGYAYEWFFSLIFKKWQTEGQSL